jgi:hypothetical protein
MMSQPSLRHRGGDAFGLLAGEGSRLGAIVLRECPDAQVMFGRFSPFGDRNSPPTLTTHTTSLPRTALDLELNEAVIQRELSRLRWRSFG